MSKRLVVRTLICSNCSYSLSYPGTVTRVLYCCLHDKPVYPTESFCSAFDGLPLLEVGCNPKCLVDTSTAYIVR